MLCSGRRTGVRAVHDGYRAAYQNAEKPPPQRDLSSECLSLFF